MSEVIVAGAKAGIPIKGRDSAVEVFTQLKSASKESNFWAMKAVATIESLTSGHMKDSVYVSEEVSGARQLFKVVMPGCSALVMKRAKGEYYLVSFSVDGAYSQKQQARKKPAYYEVREGDSQTGYVPMLVENGKVSREGYPVVVTDRYVSLQDATANSAFYVKKATNVTTSRGFGMHFTPGTSSIGGWKPIKHSPGNASDVGIKESAMLLARTMQQARELEGITWVSEQGGSGVFTEAMRILKTQKVKFIRDNKHQAFFASMTTSTMEAESLARELGIQFERTNKHFDSLLNMDQTIGSGRLLGGNIRAAWSRFRNEPDHTFIKFTNDVVKEVSGGTSIGSKLGKVGTAIAVLGGGTVAATGMAPYIGLAVALAGAAPSVYKGFFTSHYRKIAGKF